MEMRELDGVAEGNGFEESELGGDVAVAHVGNIGLDGREEGEVVERGSREGRPRHSAEHDVG